MRLWFLGLLVLTFAGTVYSIQELKDNFPFEKNLWLYWHENFENASITIRLCYEKYKEITKKANFDLILLNRTNLKNYISNFDENFLKVRNNSRQTEVANIADLIRLLVL